MPGVKVIRDDILYGETDSEASLNHDQNVVRLLERAKSSFDKEKFNLWAI